MMRHSGSCTFDDKGRLLTISVTDPDGSIVVCEYTWHV
jgi:hypothetical protein